ncbi:hypothetical protein CBM2599_B50052 [Cupriavidus taiwanensis]|nr:hypothetical protein CBM2600_B10936 [Cupriavidus taiwanensis]SOY96031.1 hypothetical protein CBM2599_B50052 [Cupriavidus taiwanensis]
MAWLAAGRRDRESGVWLLSRSSGDWLLPNAPRDGAVPTKVGIEGREDGIRKSVVPASAGCRRVPRGASLAGLPAPSGACFGAPCVRQ